MSIGYGGTHHVIDLSSKSSITSAISSLIASTMNKDKLLEMTEEFVSTLCEEGASVAMANCPVESGALKETISHETETKGTKVIGTVTAGTQHAAFVEFGTGVVGMGTYPGDTQDWEYSIGKNIDSEGGWTYYDGNKDEFHYTKGHEAQPFMYEASKYMEQRAESLAKEVKAK